MVIWVKTSHMKPKFYISILFILAAGLLLFTECTKQELTNCGVAVRFTYTKHVEGIKFSDEVSHIDLYVFDKDGNFLFKKSSKPSDVKANGFLPENYEIKLPDLKPGTYTFVAWANASPDFFDTSALVEGATSFNKATLTYRDDGVNQRGEQLSLFYGSKFSVTVPEDATGTVVVPLDLTKYSNHISIAVHGFPEGFNTEDFHCTIVSKNGNYLFNGTFATLNPAITYNAARPTNPLLYGYDSETLLFDFYILRETDDNLTDAKLVITYTRPSGEVITFQEKPEPLDPLLKNLGVLRQGKNNRNTGNLDLDHEFFIDIDIIFNDTTGTATIQINDWEPVEPIIPRPLN